MVRVGNVRTTRRWAPIRPGVPSHRRVLISLEILILPLILILLGASPGECIRRREQPDKGWLILSCTCCTSWLSHSGSAPRGQTPGRLDSEQLRMGPNLSSKNAGSRSQHSPLCAQPLVALNARSARCFSAGRIWQLLPIVHLQTH